MRLLDWRWLDDDVLEMRSLTVIRKAGLYGCTGAHRQALQIAINRALYMDELSYRRKPRFARLVRDMSDLVERLAQVAIDCLLKST